MKRGLGIAVAAIASAIGLGAGLSRASTPPSIVFPADRAPMVSDEIYRLDPNGRRVDLSRSPYRDTNPVVSSDGRRVAFISDRRGTTGLYEVGVNGRGLVVVLRNGRVPKLGAGSPLAWQPHGRRLAVDFPSTVAIVRPRRKAIYVRGQSFGSWQQPWSPDGRVLLVWTGSALR